MSEMKNVSRHRIRARPMAFFVVACIYSVTVMTPGCRDEIPGGQYYGEGYVGVIRLESEVPASSSDAREVPLGDGSVVRLGDPTDIRIVTATVVPTVGSGESYSPAVELSVAIASLQDYQAHLSRHAGALTYVFAGDKLVGAFHLDPGVPAIGIIAGESGRLSSQEVLDLLGAIFSSASTR